MMRSVSGEHSELVDIVQIYQFHRVGSGDPMGCHDSVAEMRPVHDGRARRGTGKSGCEAG